ncbi:hypothetical protein ACFQ49_10395 [Kroppenstedtia eburnea]
MGKWVKGILIAITPVLFISALAITYTSFDSAQVSAALSENSKPGGS